MESKSLPEGGFKAWLVCLSAALFFFYEFYQLNIFDVINQPLRTDFNLNAEQLSWMSSMYVWANTLFLIPAGLLLDYFSPRKLILVAMAICVIGTFGFATTDSFVLACFYHFLTGIGNAFCFLSCVILVVHWFPPARQALVIGMVVTLAFLGGMMAHAPFAQLVDWVGWRQALLMDGLAGVILWIWIAAVVRDKHASFNETKASKSILHSFLEALGNKQNWLAGVYTALLNLPIMVLCALWGTSFLQVVHHLTELQASTVASFIFIGSIIGCPLFGWLSDRQQKRKPIMILGAIATLVSLLPLISTEPLSLTVLTGIFFSVGLFSSTQVIGYPLIADSNASKNTGAATAIASVLIMGGGGLGQLLFGWMMQHHQAEPLVTYTAADFQYAMWMFPIAAFLALVAVWRAQETYCQRLKIGNPHANG